ncbi:MAG: ATP-binding protein [Sedimentisphaerales bacterium]|jgi:two-component system phosphate regulon sensor histidine kinase PhoR|nr:ATP-binding protein [Sedimentisphaerales bacterium]NLT77809.1 HAMP domain-containing protein [Planctomycetota bacterium]
MFRRKLIWQLYPSFLATTLLALLAATAYSSYTLRTFYLDQLKEELRLVGDVAASQVVSVLQTGTAADVDALCKKLGRAGDGQMRLTVIASDGRVLGDSDENPALMEDHSNRAEIVDAIAQGLGRSIRFSPTLGRNMMYVAVPVGEAGPMGIVVRTAIPVTETERALRRIYIAIVWAGAIVAVCAALLSLLISRRISAPITRMKRIAQLFAQGQLDTRVPDTGAAELDELAGALNEMATQLQDRILTITRQRNEVKAILSSLGEGVLAVDCRGRIVSVNRAAAQLLGIDPLGAQGRHIEEVIRNVGLQQFVGQTLESDQPTEGDVSFPEEGGRFFRVHGAGLADPQGERGGAVIVLSDMTRIHRLENLRRDFVANVSHELKTPVTSIQGFAEALLDGGLDDGEQTSRYLGIIAKHAQRLNAIIDDLLSLSRLEEGTERRAILFEEVALRGVLEAAVELAGLRAEQKRIKVELSCDDSIWARINAPLLEQAIVNLVDNAVKYSDEGTIVSIEVLQKDNEVAICVRDRGCGIPKEHLARIFERFYVVDKSRSRKLGGTGLGLAIVKHIILVHGGHIGVESLPGQGTAFTLHLPR